MRRADSNLPRRMEAKTRAPAFDAPDGRMAGTDAERRAAVALRERLKALGRAANVQAIEIRPRFGLTHSVHALLAIVGSLLVSTSPALGGAVILAAAVSTFLDVTGSLHLVRRLTGRRASQNVVSPSAAGRPGVLVVAAAYDVSRGGFLARVASTVRDPWLLMLTAMLVLLVCAVLVLAGIDATAVTAVQFAPTVVLILLLPVFLDPELGEPLAKATANVEAALALAESLEGELEHFEVWALFTGAEGPFGLGMAAWLRSVRRELPKGSMAILCLEGGSGDIRFARRDGPLLPLRANRQLVRVCGEIAEDDGPDGAFGAEAVISRAPRNASVAIGRGFPAIGLSGDGELLEGFSRELAHRLDAEVGPTLPPR